MPIDTASIYDELLRVKISLDFQDIPTPAYLQEKILECSGCTRLVEKRIIEVTRELSMKERDFRLEKVRLEVKKRGILVNDPVIKKLPTGKEREAAADEILQKDHERVQELENDVLELQNLLSAIRLVHQNLRTTNSDIRVLMRIMEQQVLKLNVGTKSDEEVKHLVAGLSDVEKLEDELTLDDVQSSTETVEPEQGGLAEGATHTTDTALVGADAETGDSADATQSFLIDDAEEMGGETTAPGADGEDGVADPAQSAVGEEGAKNENSAPSTTEAAGDGDGGISVDGLEIDLGDVLDESPTAAESAEQSNASRSKGVVNTAETAKARVSEKESPSPPSKDSKEVTLDIDDILNSLDSG